MKFKNLFKNKNTTYFLLLLILAIVQSFYFLVSGVEPWDTQIFFVICTFLIYILIGSFSKKLLNIFILFSFLVTCLIFPIIQIYGTIDYPLINSVFYSNKISGFSYIKTLNKNILLPLFFLAIFSFFLIQKKVKIRLGKKVKIIILVLLIFFPIRKYLIPHDENRYQYVYFLPLNKVLKINHYYSITKDDKKDFIDALKKPNSWKIIEKDKQATKRNIVVIIGESVRKDFLHSYGFPIKNTPFIDSSNCVQFDNYIAVASHTVESLTRTIALSENLTDYNVSNNLITLSKKADYKTYWISNQGIYGKYSSPVSEIGLQADFHYFLPKKNWKHQKDDAILPHFKKVMQDTVSHKMIVLHMQGSHPLVSDRTDGVYDEFVKSKEFSCYSKTIKDLDEFLKNVYTELVKRGESFDMIYFSDHGLKIREDGYISHSNGVKECYQVPLLLWSDKTKERKKIEATRTGKDFLHLFSEILGIKTANIKRSYQFLSEDKNDDKQIEVNTEDKKKYEDLENNPISLLFEE